MNVIALGNQSFGTGQWPFATAALMDGLQGEARADSPSEPLRQGFNAARLAIMRALTWLCIAGLALTLSACRLFESGGYRPQWIEAPLVADGQIDATNSGDPYQGFSSQLKVSPSSTAVMRFSLASLPNASSRRTSSTIQPYALSADKVLSARIVVYVESIEKPGYVALTALKDTDANGPCYVEYSAPRCNPIAGSVRNSVCEAFF